MKKTLILFAAMLCAVLSSQAAYLYWQVSESDIASYPSYSSDNSYIAQVKAYEEGSDSTAATVVQSAKVPTDGIYSVDVSSFQNYSFFVEVFQYTTADSQSLGVIGGQETGVRTYSDLVNNGAIVTGADLNVSISQVWHGGSSFSTAPEPTSGLLLAMGLALLGLKRRKV